MTKSKNVVPLGRSKKEPDPRIVGELARLLDLAEKGEVGAIVTTALITTEPDPQDHAYETRWFDANREGDKDTVHLMGMAQNALNAISTGFYEAGYLPEDEDEDG